MSRQNPKKAMAALLPLEMRTVGGDTVRPMTLGMYAALERIASPMVTGDDPKDILDLIPSLYLITHDPREVFRGDLLDAAMKWADARPVSTLQSIRKAAARQMNAALDVIPEEDEEDRKKKTGHDGWIAALVNWAAREYGWSFDEILWEVPLSALCLLRRQPALQENKIFPLSEIEKIDNGNT